MISIQRLRQHLDDLSVSEEARILRVRDAVVQSWERETATRWARTVSSVIVINTLDDDGISYIFPRVQNITALLSVDVRSIGQADWTTLDSSGYELLGDGSIYRVADLWADFVQITATFGYEDDAAPEDVLHALETQIRYLMQRQNDGNLIVQSQNFEGGSGVFMDSVQHPEFSRLVKYYRQRAG